MSLSDYLECSLLNAILRNVSFAGGATIYLALHTADPLDAGTGAEVSGGSYARQGLTSGFPAATGSTGQVLNTNDITFPEATAPWGTISHVQLWDSLSGGNAYWSGPLNQTIVVDTGDTFQIDAGEMEGRLS